MPSLDELQVDELLLGFGDADPSETLDVEFDPFSLPPETGADPAAGAFAVAASAVPEEAALLDPAALLGDVAFDDAEEHLTADDGGADTETELIAAGLAAGGNAPRGDESTLQLELDAELRGTEAVLSEDSLAETEAGGDGRPAEDAGDQTGDGVRPRARSMPPMPGATRPPPAADPGSESSSFRVPPPSAFPSVEEPGVRAEVPLSGSYDRLPPLGVFRSSQPPPATPPDADDDDEFVLDGDEDELELDAEGTDVDVELSVDDDDDLAGPPPHAAAAPPRARTSAPPPPPVDESFGDLEAFAPPAASAGVSAVRADTGARAARRTVTDRKPRREDRAFVGDDPATLARRSDLLERLAATRNDPTHRGRLLAAAAELRARCGDAERAAELLAAAHEAQPADLATLRALRRTRLEDGDYAGAAKALEEEVALPVSAADRAAAWALLAQLRFLRLGDLPGARAAAESAFEIAPSVTTALALAEVHGGAGDIDAARAALERAATLWADGAGSAVLETQLGRAHEVEGRMELAASHYARALRAAPADLSAALGLARTGEHGAGARALLEASAHVASGRLGEALARAAARRAGLAKDATLATRAARLLASSERAASLSVAASATEEPALRQSLLARLASATRGTARALALLRQAEEHAERGDLDGADGALRDAALADESLDLTHVVREVLARRAGDPARLARAVEMESQEGGALQAAARMAAEAPGSELEERWLERAASEGRTPFTVEELRLDLALARGDEAAAAAALRKRAERLPSEHQAGPLLALAERLPSDDAEALLFELARADSGRPVVGRSLAARVFPRYAQASAELWRAEADAATEAPQRGALAATWAGRAGSSDATSASEALHEALTLRPGHGPARWALAEQLAERGEAAQRGPGVVVEGHERLAESTLVAFADAPQAAMAWLRLAHARSQAESEDAEGRGPAGGAFEGAVRALEKRGGPVDALLLAYVGEARNVGAALRARLFRRVAEEASEEDRRDLERRAARALEEDGHHDEAARILRALVERAPNAELEDALTRNELAGSGADQVAARRRAALTASKGDPEAQRPAREALAAFELRHGTPESAIEPLEAILASSPGHLPSLRALERVAMDAGDDAALRDIEGRLARALTGTEAETSPSVRDAEAHARLAVRLLAQPDDASGDAADTLLLELAPRILEAGSATSAWTLRRLVAAYRAAGDEEGTLAALLALAESVDREPAERLAVLLEAAPLVGDLRDPKEGAKLLAGADPAHPFVAAVEAKLIGAAGDAGGLADAASRAAEAARTPAQRLGHGYVAAQAWELAGQPAKALEAYQTCAGLDVSYREVFPRLRALLEQEDDTEALAQLVAKRLAAGADGETLVSLHEAHAALRKRLGDLDGARESLAAALTLAPDRPESLAEQARLALRVGAHREAAEALIRYARLTRDRAELRWVFFTLGDIYDRHLPDIRRADAAFKRVLKLMPQDEEALGRLADLYERAGQWDAAVGALARLVALAKDTETRRPLALRLAEAHERRGDLRAAEQTLDEERREDPTEPEILAALADLYGRQGATAALSMHLGRAATDLRRALDRRPDEAELWEALADVLDRRDRRDGARVVAAAAQAFDAASPSLAERSPEARVPGAAAAAMDPDVVRTLSPGLREPTFALFRHLADALDKVLPYDARSLQARKASREHPARLQARALAPAFGFADAQLLIAPGAHWAPVSASPPTVLLGESFATLPEAPRAFLLTRALAALSLRLEAPLRAPGDRLALSLAGLVRHADPSYAPKGMDEEQLDDAGRRLVKAVPRRHRDALGPLAIEVVAAADFEVATLAERIDRLADRIALLVLGDLGGALDALLALAGLPHGSGAHRAAGLREVPAARALLAFALDDLHLDARRKTGAERL